MKTYDKDETQRLWNAVSKEDAVSAADALTAGADPNGQECLSYAASIGALEIVRILLAAGATPRSGGSNPPLASAAFYGRHEIMEAILAADPTFGLEVALRSAAIQRQTRSVEILLAAGADPKANDSEALSWAIRKDARGIILALITAGADLAAAEVSARAFAARGRFGGSRAADFRSVETVCAWARGIGTGCAAHQAEFAMG